MKKKYSYAVCFQNHIMIEILESLNLKSKVEISKFKFNFIQIKLQMDTRKKDIITKILVTLTCTLKIHERKNPPKFFKSKQIKTNI